MHNLRFMTNPNWAGVANLRFALAPPTAGRLPCPMVMSSKLFGSHTPLERRSAELYARATGLVALQKWCFSQGRPARCRDQASLRGRAYIPRTGVDPLPVPLERAGEGQAWKGGSARRPTRPERTGAPRDSSGKDRGGLPRYRPACSVRCPPPPPERSRKLASRPAARSDFLGFLAPRAGYNQGIAGRTPRPTSGKATLSSPRLGRAVISFPTKAASPGSALRPAARARPVTTREGGLMARGKIRRATTPGRQWQPRGGGNTGYWLNLLIDTNPTICGGKLRAAARKAD